MMTTLNNKNDRIKIAAATTIIYNRNNNNKNNNDNRINQAIKLRRGHF